MRARRAPVAQLDRATDFESVGRGFEPLRARQILGLAGIELRHSAVSTSAGTVLHSRKSPYNGHLLERFGPAAGAFQTGRLPHESAVFSNAVDAEDVTLPDAPGRELVQMRRALCHGIGRVISLRRSRKEWVRITIDMIERGPQAPPAQAIVSYLSAQFGD